MWMVTNLKSNAISTSRRGKPKSNLVLVSWYPGNETDSSYGCERVVEEQDIFLMYLVILWDSDWLLFSIKV